MSDNKQLTFDRIHDGFLEKSDQLDFGKKFTETVDETTESKINRMLGITRGKGAEPKKIQIDNFAEIKSGKHKIFSNLLTLTNVGIKGPLILKTCNNQYFFSPNGVDNQNSLIVHELSHTFKLLDDVKAVWDGTWDKTK